MEKVLIVPLANLSPQKIVKSKEWGELRHLTTRDIMGSQSTVQAPLDTNQQVSEEKSHHILFLLVQLRLKIYFELVKLGESLQM